MPNDFSTDPSCKARWRFEAGALLADAISTNTLTANGAPGQDTVDFKEGAACATLTAVNQWLYVSDSNLAAGFPLKNGDATKQITVSGWFKWNGFSGSGNVLFAKGNGGNGSSFQIMTWGSGALHLAWWYNSTSGVYDYNIGFTPTIGRWYHISVMLDGVAKTIRVRIWDDVQQFNALDWTTSPANGLNIGTQPFGLGYSNSSPSIQGKVDELVVFNRILNSIELDKIRAGTYTGPITMLVRSHYDFVADANCKGWWRFEPASFLVDSKALNSNLTLHNTVTSDAVNFIEGTGSAYFGAYTDQHNWLYVADSGLAAGFPLKSGDSVKRATIFFRAKMAGYTGYPIYNLIGKRNATANDPGFCLYCQTNTGGCTLHFAWGYGSGSAFTEESFSVCNLSTDRWLTFALAIDGVNKVLRIFIIDETNAGTLLQFNFTPVNQMRVNAQPLTIGNGNYDATGNGLAGNMDSVAFINQLLSYNDIQAIMGWLPYIPDPPANSKCLTSCGGLANPNLTKCVSLTRIESIVAPLANLTSHSTCQTIPENRIGKCTSLTISQRLELAIPHACDCKSKCQGIPPFNDGLFLIF